MSFIEKKNIEAPSFKSHYKKEEKLIVIYGEVLRISTQKYDYVPFTHKNEIKAKKN